MLWTSNLKRRRAVLRLLSVLVLGGLAGVIPSGVGQARDDDQGCTAQTISGAYGFRATGVSLQNDGTMLPFASVGRYVRDGQGNFSLKLTSVTGGATGHLSGTGTYTVNADCTGSQTVTFTPPEMWCTVSSLSWTEANE